MKEIIHGYLTNQITEPERGILSSWINQSEENRKIFNETCRLWQLASQVQNRGRFNKIKYEEWGRLLAKLITADKNIPDIHLSPFQKFMRFAAVFLFLLAVGTTIAWRITSGKLQRLVTSEITHQVDVPKGSKADITLPDGTKVTLNAGSRLQYPGNFGIKARDVVLIGEGYFNVVPNAELPFVVNTSGLKIKAVGTIFNVKAYPEEGSVTTTLVEGNVKIEGEGVNLTMSPRQKITLVTNETGPVFEKETAGQKEIATAAPPEKVSLKGIPQINSYFNVNTDDLTAWKDGCLIFKSEKLADLAVLVERKFNVTIHIESAELKRYMFTGAFQKETLEQILDILNLSAPIQYQIDKGIVNIRIDPERRSLFKKVISE